MAASFVLVVGRLGLVGRGVVRSLGICGSSTVGLVGNRGLSPITLLLSPKIKLEEEKILRLPFHVG